LSKSDTTLASEIHQDQFAFIKPLSVESMKVGSIVGKKPHRLEAARDREPPEIGPLLATRDLGIIGAAVRCLLIW
jgi:hypothetical protein